VAVQLGQSRAAMAKRRRIDLKKTMFLLPNMITLASIYCGFRSLTLTAASSEAPDAFYQASLFLVFSLFFDMLDGRVARLTKTQSSFGLQIDSLADVICFGVAPALMVYRWSLHAQGTAGLVVSFAFAGAGAVRLARFNVLSMDESGKPQKPSKYIVGLPVPGAAGILISLIIANHTVGRNLQRYPLPIMALTVFLAFLQVSTIQFRSFKDVKFNLRSVALVCFAVGSSAVVSLQFKPAFVLTWLLSFYVAIGLFETVYNLFKRKPVELDTAAATEPNRDQ
jgi:CDP-diacylglycerol---serine O-phosphatidyltransferase